MRFSFYSAILLLTLPSSPVFSANSAVRCAGPTHDRYDLGWIMRTGKYAGKCVDTSVKRPVQVLHESKDFLEIANFFHDGKFWNARIPRQGVSHLRFLDFEWDVSLPHAPTIHTRVAHTFMGISMKEDSPVLLEAQAAADQGTTASVWELAYSIDYAAPKGIDYGVLEGESGNFSAVGVLDALSSRIAPDDGEVHQRELLVTPEERNDFVLAAAQESQARGIGTEIYTTTGNNCTTALFNLMDRVFEYEEPVPPFRIHAVANFHDPIAGPSTAALLERKLVDPDAKLPPVNSVIPEIKRKEASTLRKGQGAHRQNAVSTPASTDNRNESR